MRKFLFNLCLMAAIFATCQSLKVHCDFNHITWENIDNAYTCSVNDFNVQSSGETVEEITGTHELGKNNSDVKKLNIAKQNCRFIPKGFEKFFPNLEGLRVAESGLIKLHQIDLSVHPKLRNCDVYRNPLEVIEADTFAKNPELEYLYFGFNQIKSIGVDALKPLKKLKKVIFRDNLCINENAETKTQIEILQEEMNENCATISNVWQRKVSHLPSQIFFTRRGQFVHPGRKGLLSAIQKDSASYQAVPDDELEKQEEGKKIEDSILQRETSSRPNFLLLVLIPIVMIAGFAVGMFFEKYRANRQTSNNTVRFFPAYNEMENRLCDNVA